MKRILYSSEIIGSFTRNDHELESVAQDEAVELAKDIFHRWVGKVRQSVPSPVHNL